MSSLDHGYWKSLAELEAGPPAGVVDDGPGTDDGVADHDKVPHEFPASATDASVSDPMSRRNMMQLMGASLALAGVAGTGCRRWEKDEIVPLSRRPEDMTPGVTQQYATAWDFAGFGQALVATSYEGRPIKLDGNPEHPFASGGTVPGTERHGGSSAFAQAAILGMYDPDRSRSALRGGQGATFSDFRAWLETERAQLLSSSSKIRVLSEASSSPTLARLQDRLRAAFPGLQWYEWEPVSFDNERAGLRLAFGRPMRALARLDRARTIVTLDADLFVEHPAALRYSRDWARSRRFGQSSLGEGVMSRLYAIESAFSSTGAVADHRLPIRSEQILPLAMAIDARLSGGSAPPAEFLAEANIARFVDVMVRELQANRGASVIVAGRRQPPELHALVARINQALGAVGTTLDYVADPAPQRLDHGAAIGQLVRELQQDQVDYLFILGGNPVYAAPADLDFAGALAKVKRASVHLSEYQDETSLTTSWHVPRAHFLEAWSDARTFDGTVTIAQPLIQPMFGGMSAIELAQLLLDGNATPDGMKAVKETVDDLPGATWRRAVHDGFVAGSQLAVESGMTVQALATPPVSQAAMGGTRTGKDQVEIVFVPSTQTWDGRFANNAWLWETPDFLTKMTWDNYAMVGAATAKEFGFAQDMLLKVAVGGREITVPCYVMAGQANYSIAVVLGGGRSAAGHTGGLRGRTVGFDVNKLRATETGIDIASGGSVSAAGGSYQLATTQEHWDIRDGLVKDMAQRGIERRLFNLVREATLEDTRRPDWKAEVDHHFPLEAQLFPVHEYPEERVHAWGMTIDLGSCTGCNACSLACQAENNIPVVGKGNVIRNREMHWIRIDRYFHGPSDNPQVVHQPLGCVHCENAPCEQVCPVGATIHSSEGLNDMVYNRCVGTRYCLNNCSYRVRRFNFFDYNKEFKEARNKVRKLLFNPDVTVRHRGVMEKCTYCVQRIQSAKITAKNKRIGVADGDIVTACQAACPTEAIVFGDLNDPNSRVRKLQQDRRQYELLGDFNTRPRTHHLARVRNPNPELESHDDHRGSH
jgi:molybdopterin-containing oxidoreductase family iron-sulfur binding subunit